MGFDQGLIKGVGSEDTTRGRSFLFFALATFAGTGLGGEFSVLVPENGLMALNVPLDPLRLGALSTRTTHPFYMAAGQTSWPPLAFPDGSKTPIGTRPKARWLASAPILTSCDECCPIRSPAPRRPRAGGMDMVLSTVAIVFRA